MALIPGVRLNVFSIRKRENGATVWVRAGVAFVNKDESLNVYLDMWPIDGKLHLREAVLERRDVIVPNVEQAAISTAPNLSELNGPLNAPAPSPGTAGAGTGAVGAGAVNGSMNLAEVQVEGHS